MTGIRTSAAAQLLGVSPSTLRAWERRLGYPKPRRSAGNHRQYELAELEDLRDALRHTGDISSAVAIARDQGPRYSSPERLVDAFDSFDEEACAREMEESLTIRSIERTIEEVLVPALEAAEARPGGEAELEYGCRWATGWLFATRRLVPTAFREHGVLLLDATAAISIDGVCIQALELFLRRAGLRVLSLSARLPGARFASAMGALRPDAVVLCGDARFDTLASTLRNLRGFGAISIYGYRTPELVAGREGLRVLDPGPAQATGELVEALSPRTVFAR